MKKTIIWSQKNKYKRLCKSVGERPTLPPSSPPSSYFNCQFHDEECKKYIHLGIEFASN